MRQMANDEVKVQMCVTSPPYFGLRDYGTAKWKGGNVNCDHIGAKVNPLKVGGFTGERLRKEGGKENEKYLSYKKICPDCNAVQTDSQIGLEQTPQEFINNLVEVFACVWDILADNGTLWVNLGDSYANNSSQASNNGRAGFGNPREKVVNRIGNGYKQKDLMGMPWRLAFALQDFGWYLRQDIIWHKPNPMPESVTDRCTKSHEYIFLLTKNQKYYFDHEAIKELSTDTYEGKRGKLINRNKTQSAMTDRVFNYDYFEDSTRNKRDVWSVPVKAYSGAHFAVYPEELIEPCILAGSKAGDIVLDPFFGSGTTGAVAQKLGRKWVGCELNKNYEKLQNERLAQQGLELA
jgi:site-specific DNA-methyltransferase (cytosine-N4-specific)